jgi:hypothetical protein
MLTNYLRSTIDIRIRNLVLAIDHPLKLHITVIEKMATILTA